MTVQNFPMVINPCTSALAIAKQISGQVKVAVLPDKVRRLSHLLEQKNTQVLALVDFPLGNGMTAKKAFEIGKAFEDHADGVLVCLTPRLFHENNFILLKQAMAIFQSLSFGRGELSFMFNLSTLKESEKLDFSDWLKTEDYRSFTLMFDEHYALENDLAIFRFALGDRVELNLFNQFATPLDRKILTKYGIASVFNRLDKLPVIEK